MSALERAVVIRPPGPVRLLTSVMLLVGLLAALGPGVISSMRDRDWTGALVLLAFSAVWSGGLYRISRLAVLSEGPRLVVRNSLHTRVLDRSEIRDVAVPAGLSVLLGGNVLALVLADGSMLPLEATSRWPVPGHRIRAAARAEQLRDWLRHGA